MSLLLRQARRRKMTTVRLLMSNWAARLEYPLRSGFRVKSEIVAEAKWQCSSEQTAMVVRNYRRHQKSVRHGR
jgi:hypothetical protein